RGGGGRIRSSMPEERTEGRKNGRKEERKNGIAARKNERMTPVSYPSLGNDEALRLLERPDVLILDVRTPQEHAQLGHMPGARLLPVQCIASAPAVLPRDGRPVLVYC